MVEDACNLDRRVRGPAAYYRCLDHQLQALRSDPDRPDLTAVSAAERDMIESACNLDRRVRGPAAYYRCLGGQLRSLSNGPRRPDLAGISAAERDMIESACNLDRRVRGPAAYYRCISGQLASLNPRRNGRPAAARSGSEFLGTRKAIPERRGENGIALPGKMEPSASEVSSIVPSRHADSSEHSGSTPVAVVRDPVAVPPPAAEPSRTPTESVPVPRTPTPQGSSGFWVVGVISLALVLAGIVKALIRHRRIICPACGSAVAGWGACEKCRGDASARSQESAQAEPARRARVENERREEQRGQEAKSEDERRRLWTLDDLNRLTGKQFEELIGSLFARDGYTVRHCGGSGDDGIDLVLQMGQTKDVVQCKRWKSDIGSPVVRDFYGALMHAGARHGFIITTASFSPSARNFAVGKPITLLPGTDILRWLDGHYSSRREYGQAAGRTRSGEETRRDPYLVLGLHPGATKDEIRAAYRNRMSKYHPDKVAHLGIELQELAKAKALELNQAYETLSQTV